jgi:uncharacterized protein (DUF2384 family)
MNHLAQSDVQQQQVSSASHFWSFLPSQIGALGNTINSSTSIFINQPLTPYMPPSGNTSIALSKQLVNFGARNLGVRNYQIPIPSVDQRRSHTVKAGRITGPVRVLRKITDDWGLSRHEVARLLAYPEDKIADNLLDGIVTLREQDREDRVLLMYQIYRVLSSLFPEQENQRKWLRAPNQFLNGQNPLDVMLTKRIPGMVLVRNLVDRLAGR